VLETGDRQTDALRLYRRYGFTDCPPFGEYATLPPDTITASIFLEKSVAHVPNTTTQRVANEAVELG